MAIEIVKSSQDKNGYTKDNVVTLILDKAEDINAAGTDYDPGSFAYTADMTGCWQLNTEHEWILVDGSSAMTLSYEAQELTDVQKNQARTNIGAQEVLVGVAGQVVGFNEDGVAVAQEAPSGVTSWNDLEDRPVVMVGATDTVTWDGNTEGHVTVLDNTIVKVSDAEPTLSDLSNGGYAVINGETQVFTSSDVTEEWKAPEGFIAFGGIYIIPTTLAGVPLETMGNTVFPESGVYFVNISGNIIATELHIVGYTGFGQEKLDAKYLPESPIVYVNVDNATMKLERTPAEIRAMSESGKYVVCTITNNPIITEQDSEGNITAHTSLLNPSPNGDGNITLVCTLVSFDKDGNFAGQSIGVFTGTMLS